MIEKLTVLMLNMILLYCYVMVWIIIMHDNMLFWKHFKYFLKW